MKFTEQNIVYHRNNYFFVEVLPQKLFSSEKISKSDLEFCNIQWDIYCIKCIKNYSTPNENIKKEY